jgi:hypothetical protein
MSLKISDGRGSALPFFVARRKLFVSASTAAFIRDLSG